ncbi:hypothetical protein LguiA_022591 [Lonicera macranthoides]
MHGGARVEPHHWLGVSRDITPNLSHPCLSITGSSSIRCIQLDATMQVGPNS